MTLSPSQAKVLRRVSALLLGALSVLAYAPFSYGVILLPVLALLIWFWRMDATPREAAITGYCFGLGQMGVGASWVNVSITQFGGMPEAASIAITFLFVMIVAAYFALLAWAARRLYTESYEAVWALLIVPATWGLVEWIRSWLFTGFPWLSLGYSQIDLPLTGFAPLLGVFGVSVMLVVSAGFVYLWRRWWAIICLAGFWLLAAGLNQLSWVEKDGEAFEVSIVQPSIPQSEKWLPEAFQPTLRLYQQMTDAAPNSRLVIWPETAVPAFNTRVEESFLQPLHEILSERNQDLLLGIPYKETEAVYYNAMISLGVTGRDSYFKRHLVPFGEYVPLDFLLRPVIDLLHIPMSDFSRGDESKQPLIELAGYQVGVDICYEDAFGSEIIKAMPQARFLVNASNDAWFGDSFAPHQHLEIARMRALESGRYLLRATNTGVSAFIDEKGRLIKIAPLFERVLLQGQVQPMQGVTPYAALGNIGLMVLLLLMFFAAWVISLSKARWASGH